MGAKDWQLIVAAFYLGIIVFFSFTAQDVFGKARPEAIPPLALKYRPTLIREARFLFGLTAPTSTFSSQIHAESNWNPSARSRSGATGLTQFMPRTAAWMAKRYPDLRPVAPLNPIWSIRAMLRYDRYLWDKARGWELCPRMKLTLASYNAGEGRMYKQWPKETRAYVHRILQVLEPLYVANGWGSGSCS